MKSPAISIIIPVYNVEEYISRCLDSVYDQDIEEDNYEVIIVNDGTTDNTMKIVQKYALKHQNIIQINKENGGVSSARNVGIEKSIGKYILFLDADDAIKEKVLDAILIEMENFPVEFLILNSFEIDDKLKSKREVYKFPHYLSGITVSGTNAFNKGYFRGSVCGVVFEKQFFQKYCIRFREDLRNSEDTLFMAKCFIYGSCLRHSNLNLYKVFGREGSASQSWDYRRIKDMLGIFSALKEYIKDDSLSASQCAILHYQSYIAICEILSQLFSIRQFDKYMEMKRYILNSSLYPVKKIGIKNNRVKINLLNYSFDFFSSLLLIKIVLAGIKRN